MNAHEQFQKEVSANIDGIARDLDLQALSRRWILETSKHRYSYNFEYMGRPIIQYPQDMVAIQELIWRVKPDVVIETGIAHGGSLVMNASMLAMLDYCDAIRSHQLLDPSHAGRRVIGVDIDIRSHNRSAIESHPLSHRISMIQGSSIAPDVISQVRNAVSAHERVLVCLDSNHTQEHVLAELDAYAPLVSPDSYCVIFDTIIEQMPDSLYADRPWKRGNSPMSAVDRFMSSLETKHVSAIDGSRLCFEIDSRMDSKLLISVAPRGFLRRIHAAT